MSKLNFRKCKWTQYISIGTSFPAKGYKLLWELIGLPFLKRFWKFYMLLWIFLLHIVLLNRERKDLVQELMSQHHVVFSIGGVRCQLAKHNIDSK